MFNSGYPLKLSPLYKIRNKRKLAALLFTDLKSLLKASSPENYEVFPMIMNGKERIIESPKQELKKIQSRLYDLLSRIQTPDWLSSGIKGKSYIDNAVVHKNSKFLLKTDINSFYKNCSEKNIYMFFKYQLEMSSDAAYLLTKVVTYNGFLPTGAPTSQKVAFLAYYNTFVKIHDIAVNHGAIMTLYVDDICISSNKPLTKKLIYEIEKELKKVGHSLKRKKTKMYKRADFKVITGVAISPNNEMKVPNKLREKIVKSLDLLESQNDKKIKESLLGCLKSARNIEPSFMENTIRRIK